MEVWKLKGLTRKLEIVLHSTKEVGLSSSYCFAIFSGNARFLTHLIVHSSVPYKQWYFYRTIAMSLKIHTGLIDCARSGGQLCFALLLPTTFHVLSESQQYKPRKTP